LPIPVYLFLFISHLSGLWEAKVAANKFIFLDYYYQCSSCQSYQLMLFILKPMEPYNCGFHYICFYSSILESYIIMANLNQIKGTIEKQENIDQLHRIHEDILRRVVVEINRDRDWHQQHEKNPPARLTKWSWHYYQIVSNQFTFPQLR
jgi:hypothetical protein